MPKNRLNAFVIGSKVIKEQDKLIVLLTQERGIVNAIAPGAVKFKNRFGPVFELFTEGEFFFHEKENQKLFTISKGDIIKSNFFLVSNPKNIFTFYLLAEIVIKFIPHKSDSRRVYKLLKSLLDLPKDYILPPELLLYFLLWILRIEGLLFRTNKCSNCLQKIKNAIWIKSDYRGILCVDCKQDESMILNKDEISFIRWTKNNSPKKIEEFERSIDVKKLIRYFIKMIEYNGEISLKTTNYIF